MMAVLAKLTGNNIHAQLQRPNHVPAFKFLIVLGYFRICDCICIQMLAQSLRVYVSAPLDQLLRPTVRALPCIHGSKGCIQMA